LTRWRPNLDRPTDWVRWIRLVAVPFVLAEVAVERGNYPPGDEAWAWALAAAFAVGAVAVLAAPAAVGFVFDLLVVSGFVSLYGFEPSSPVRQLFVLTALEAGLLFGPRGVPAAALASVPALVVFEERASDVLDEPFDPGHVLGPVGIQLLVGLVVGTLARRARTVAK
jgi:hypothetical protein